MTKDSQREALLHLNNALHSLNLDRPDIAALSPGQDLHCSINSQRRIGDDIKKAIDAITRAQPKQEAEDGHDTEWLWIRQPITEMIDEDAEYWRENQPHLRTPAPVELSQKHYDWLNDCATSLLMNATSLNKVEEYRSKQKTFLLFLMLA